MWIVSATTKAPCLSTQGLNPASTAPNTIWPRSWPANHHPFMMKEPTTKIARPDFAEPRKMYKTQNDICEDVRSELSALMNQRLASAVDLQTQMKQAHWNVKGPSFIGLHELFDK